jgi:uncharacterized protein YwqG
MNFFKNLFNKPIKNVNSEAGINQHHDFLCTISEPAIMLIATKGNVNSRIGGQPIMPAEMEWPSWNGVPMLFLCQLDLSELPVGCNRHGLPLTGMIYFFYNQEQETWGFDPKDKGSWSVLYTPLSASDCQLRDIPEEIDESMLPEEKSLGYENYKSFPDYYDERVFSLELSSKQVDQYYEQYSNNFNNEHAHHLFGYPNPVQNNDMDLECQLVSNGLYCGDSTGYNDPRAVELTPGKSDWMLLLQLDSDEDANIMWGDSGMLYFWIRKEDLDELRFENCWMILQCY